MATPWWNREGLDVRDGRLQFAGRDAESIAREHGTPLFVFDPSRMERNLRRLQKALEHAGVRHRLLYAFKANRQPAMLARLREMEDIGVDVCSPNEVEAALEAGWKAEEISYTGTNLSRRDFDRILPHPLLLNLDSLSAIEKVGTRCPGRAVGLRVNHEAVERAAEMARQIPDIEYINVGGGIGVRLLESHRAPDLDAYAHVVLCRPVGGYGPSMASEHCSRPHAKCLVLSE